MLNFGRKLEFSQNIIAFLAFMDAKVQKKSGSLFQNLHNKLKEIYLVS